jgi:hypothetical protein
MNSLPSQGAEKGRSMTAVDINSLATAIGRFLRMNRSSVMREERIHDGIAAALSEIGVDAEREYRLTTASRLDFFIPDLGTAIEVKKGPVALPVLHQIGRYFESPRVTGCILIAMRIHPKIPATFAGKPLAQVSLWKYLL